MLIAVLCPDISPDGQDVCQHTKKNALAGGDPLFNGGTAGRSTIVLFDTKINMRRPKGHSWRILAAGLARR